MCKEDAGFWRPESTVRPLSTARGRGCRAIRVTSSVVPECRFLSLEAKRINGGLKGRFVLILPPEIAPKGGEQVFMQPLALEKFSEEIRRLETILREAKRVLITAPSVADGDSVGSQLALRRMILWKYPHVEIHIINDEPFAERYEFLADVGFVQTLSDYLRMGLSGDFDAGIIVDGGIDRAGRVKEYYDRCRERIFIDHHIVSVDYPYTLQFVEPTASSTTELIYSLSQLPLFQTPLTAEFAQQIYLGIVFDTGFFRYSNTTPELMELGAKLLRTGFDFTRVGERGMLERTYNSLRLLSDTLARAQLECGGRVIWSTLPQETMQRFNATLDDREGIIDPLFLTQGVEVAALFFDLGDSKTKVSFRSQGAVDVAKFARSVTQQGGGHRKSAGANFDIPMEQAVNLVLSRLKEEVQKTFGGNYTGGQ